MAVGVHVGVQVEVGVGVSVGTEVRVCVGIGEGPPKGVSWTDYQTVGPLTLPLDHVTDDGERHIRLVDVAELRDEPGAFTIPGCP